MELGDVDTSKGNRLSDGLRSEVEMCLIRLVVMKYYPVANTGHT